jgi:molybdenum cofactor biosynthesis enzyme MoaA
MAIAYKVLGQSNPAATTETTLYTVPASTETIISTISVTELAGGTPTFRLVIAINGAVTANAMYLVKDLALTANGTQLYKLGITLDASDVVRVYASDANVAFQVYGAEIS